MIMLRDYQLLISHVDTGFRIAADGSFPTAKRLVPEILDDCPVKTIRAFFRKSWRYMDAYRYIPSTPFVLTQSYCLQKGS